MSTFPLQCRNGHVFVELQGDLWLLDTGAPGSFGEARKLAIAGEQLNLGEDYVGLTAEALSRFTGVECVGLLGADVLGRFDHIFDAATGTLTVSTGELSHAGHSVPLRQFAGIPIVTARIAGNDYRMFFDTGAQISYFEDGSLMRFPSAGIVTDFYPGVGQFQTDTHVVPVSLGGVEITLRFGRLPGSIRVRLTMASTIGIIGNEVLSHRTVGYFPRRRMMVL